MRNMERLIVLFFGITILLCSRGVYASAFGSGGVSCGGITDGLVYTAQADGTCAFEAAPGASGGDAWTDAVDSDILPTGADNTYDLGSVAASFADAHIQGTATIGTVTATAVTVGGVNACTISGTQTLTNKTIDADGTGNSITNIENADIKSGAAIDAAKVHDGTVSNTEFGYLNGVSSGIQSQIDAKAPSDGDGIVDHICGHIEAPEDKEYWLVLDAKYPFTVQDITTDITSGSLTLEVEDDDVSVVSCSAISVTTTETETNCTDTAISAGADLTLVVTSASSPVDFRFCIQIERD